MLHNICDASIPSTLIGDPTKIRQIIMNLVSNAIKFTHIGQIDVRAKALAIDGDSATIKVSVSDTGIGMSPNTQTKVFEAFTQADTSTTRQYGGTGLGLAISRRFIDMMSGEIELASDLGIGTTFTVTLPLKISPHEREINPSFAKYRAQLICVNEATSEMLASHLSRFGIASSTSPYDKSMPDSGGSESIPIIDKEIVDEHPELVRFLDERAGEKGIVMTPLSDVELPRLSAGWITLSKPITSHSLWEALQTIIQSNDKTFDPQQRERKLTEKPRARVLVAEDVEVNQKIVREMLQMFSCSIEIVSNGQEAVDVYTANSFDVVFMDCQMPTMDGYEATERIRQIERERGSNRIPIIALTAGTSAEDQAKCESVGMDDYLTKPFTVSDIAKALRYSIGLETDGIESRLPPKYIPAPAVSKAEDTQQRGVEIVNIRSIGNIKEVEQQTGNDILPDIFDGFVSQMNEKLAEAESHLGTRDFESLQKTAHAMKSMSANMGADRVREMSARVESTCKAGNYKNIEESVAEIEGAFHEFCQEFKYLLADYSKVSTII